jgi:hypothetical protein
VAKLWRRLCGLIRAAPAMPARLASRRTGISADTIDWTTQWYLREETLRLANTDIVNAHYRHPMARLLGDGTLSSSDGLRLPTRGKSLTGRALSPRNGVGIDVAASLRSSSAAIDDGRGLAAGL